MKKLFNASLLPLVAVALMLGSCEPKQVPVESLTIDHELVLYVDSTAQLTATVIPENATGEINWKSNDTTVATVSNTGLVKALKKGAAVITANMGNNIDVCNVTVLNNPVTLKLSIAELAQKKCTVTVTPSDEEGYYYCGYATPSDVDKMSDAELTQLILDNLKKTLEYYAQYGMNYTLKDMLQQGKKNLIASGLTANTDYVMFAFGVDVESETASKTVTRLPFKTKEVVPSTMTFQIGLDSIAKIQKVSNGDTTYTYTGYFKCTPSNEEEGFVFQGIYAKSLDSLYNNDIMQYLTEMEAYYDKNYSSSGGFEGAMVKAGARSLRAANMQHGVSIVFFAAGYSGGFTTQATTFEYTFQHPDSVKNPMPVYRAPIHETVEELNKLTDFRGVYFPGVCH